MPVWTLLKSSLSPCNVDKAEASPPLIKSFLISQSPKLSLETVFYSRVHFISSQSSCTRPSTQWSWAVPLWNAHLKGAESQSRHDWAWLRGLHMGNQTPFQALSSSSSGAADVQGFSKAPPSNLHVRTANLLTFCLPYTHTRAHSARLAQNRHLQRSVHKTDFDHG